MPGPGIFVVLEGSDGSGKGTQFKLLKERLEATGHEVAVFDFPRYDQPSSHFVQNYLNGVYGQATALSPYASSMFYALDRFEAAPEIRQALDEGKVVISNRYVGSNMAHQGSKFSRPSEKRAFFMWADNLEYELLGIPRPNLNLFLRVPAEVAFELIKLKAERSYTKASHDQHEADINHLREAVATFDLLCQLFTKDFKAIDCTRQAKLLSIPEINNRIWEQIKPLLPEPSQKGRARTVQLDSPVKTEKAVSSTVPSEAQSFSGLAIIELLSNGAKLSAQPLAKDDYFVPKGLSQQLNQKFEAFIQDNLKRRQALRKQLNKLNDGRRSLDIQAALNQATPLAFRESADLDKQNVQFWPALAELKELQPAGSRLKKISPGSTDSYSAAPESVVQLVKPAYRNEAEALVELNYQRSGQSHKDLADEVEAMTYEEKLLKLRAIILRDQIARQQFSYSFEVLASYQAILPLVLGGCIVSGQSQSPTVRFGYDIPSVMEENGLAEAYSELFDASLELFSQIQAVQPASAAYAAMRGHRWRWLVQTDADKLTKPTSTLPEESASLVKQMKLLVKVANPIIGDYLELSASGQPKVKRPA